VSITFGHVKRSESSLVSVARFQQEWEKYISDDEEEEMIPNIILDPEDPNFQLRASRSSESEPEFYYDFH